MIETMNRQAQNVETQEARDHAKKSLHSARLLLFSAEVEHRCTMRRAFCPIT